MDNPPTSPPPQPGATPDPGARLTVQRYRIEHTLRFTYDAPVRLDQMVLRLQPRTDVNQRLFEFDIAADPQPTRQTHGIDLHGNIQHWFWFEDQHQDLTLHTRSMVDCYCDNPFDFVTVDQQAVTVPATYEEPVYTASARYRYRPKPSSEADLLAHKIMQDAAGDTQRFLVLLNTHIHQHIAYIVRPDGPAWDPAVTLKRGRGACRDTAVLFMDTCRAAGLAARFVSGYAYDAVDPDQRELHAWAEVYLPGGGWRGYDPTVGLAVTNRHVAVAASPFPDLAAPTAGTFTGPPVRSTLDYHIDMIHSQVPASPGVPGTTYHWA